MKTEKEKQKEKQGDSFDTLHEERKKKEKAMREKYLREQVDKALEKKKRKLRQ